MDAVLLFPAGTIAFGHAAGWANATESAYANTHAWAGGEGDPSVHRERPPAGSAPPPRPADEPCPRDVRVLLFAPRRDNVARTVDTEALRRLAFLAGGTGGRGSGAPTRWAPTWYGGGDRRTLAWTAQTCDGAVDFMAPCPWKVVRWQPDSLPFLPLSVKAVGGGEEAKDAAAALRALHELAGATPEEAVPAKSPFNTVVIKINFLLLLLLLLLGIRFKFRVSQSTTNRLVVIDNKIVD